MLRAWVCSGGRAAVAVPRPHAPVSPLDRQRARMLSAQMERARRAVTAALATGDWTAAAEWEEQRVVSEDELARLILERCCDDDAEDQR